MFSRRIGRFRQPVAWDGQTPPEWVSGVSDQVWSGSFLFDVLAGAVSGSPLPGSGRACAVRQSSLRAKP